MTTTDDIRINANAAVPYMAPMKPDETNVVMTHVTTTPVRANFQLISAGTDLRQLQLNEVASRQRRSLEEQNHNHDNERDSVRPALADVCPLHKRLGDSDQHCSKKCDWERQNPPITAAAKAGTSIRLIVTTEIVRIGRDQNAGRRRKDRPSAQFVAAMRSAECPSAEAERRFSEIAVVNRPNLVRL